jgi:hypothetical protein
LDPKQVDKLETERADHLGTLTGLRKRKEMNEAEIGPARYLADLIGKSADQTMELVIAAFVLALQPFAIVLLWAANHHQAEQATPVTKPIIKPVRKVARKARTAKRKALGHLPLLTANDNVLRFPRPA